MSETVFGIFRARTVHDFFAQILRGDLERARPSPMNRPTLLCVDDDPGIRQLYEAMLGTYGYEVLVAEGGHQALNLFRSKASEIDAVISDYEMPGMNGAQLAAELKRCDPEIPVIVVSGSSLNSITKGVTPQSRLRRFRVLSELVNAKMGDAAGRCDEVKWAI